MTDYDKLKKYGFSAAKAAEIELDAKRGVVLARWVLYHVRSIFAK
jgi:hypothetical protein